MNKVTEEAMTNIINRIEKLEEQVYRNLSDKEYRIKDKPTNLATEGQLKYIKILGGHIYKGMTKIQAGQEIDKLLKNRKFEENINQEIKEPEQVDTDEIGIDDEGVML